MNRQLRPYQHDTLEALRQTLRGGVRRVMVQAPTGAGKTLLAAAIAEAAYGKGRRIAFVVPRISLIDQTVEEFYAEGIEDVGVIQADHHMADASKPVQVCSIETLRSRGIYPQADVVLYDEAHVLSKQHIRWLQDAAFQGVPFIGLSATPWAKGLGRHFETLLVMATTRDLIDQGYLSPFLTFAASHPDMSNVRIVNGEYHDGESSSAMQANGLTADIVETWKKRWGQDKTLVFGVDCAHARALQERFNEAGVPCGYQDAYTPMYERTQLKRQFHSGELRVICNVDTLTLGIDWDVRCLSLCRPTRSEMRYVQIIGRALRRADGKDQAIILDHSDTTARLGLVTDIHHEHLHTGRVGDKDVRKPVPLPKTCPSCACLVPPLVQACPNCGMVRQAPRNSVVEADGELVEYGAHGHTKGSGKKTFTMQDKASFYAQLLGYCIEHGKKTGYAAHIYKDKFGVWPAGDARYVQPMRPGSVILSYVRSRNIRLAKAREKNAEASNTA